MIEIAIGVFISYLLAALSLGFLLGILAKPFKGQARTTDDYIDWSKVPEEANAIVANDDGDMFLCFLESLDPIPSNGYWNMPPGDKSMFLHDMDVPKDAIIGPLPPWRESLRKRPGK